MFQDIMEGPGKLDYSSHTWEILIMLLIAFLLGLLLGYLIWNKYKKMVLGLENENARLRSKLTDLEKDHASLRYQSDELKKDNSAHAAKIRVLEADNSILVGKMEKLEATLSGANGGGGDASTLGAMAAGAMAAMPISKRDDLKKIEGIGPKIEGLLNGDGIQTFTELSKSTVERLKGILSAAGKRYQIHDPGTWPKQAEMAARGDWDKLKEYQDFLQGGKDPS